MAVLGLWTGGRYAAVSRNHPGLNGRLAAAWEDYGAGYRGFRPQGQGGFIPVSLFVMAGLVPAIPGFACQEPATAEVPCRALYYNGSMPGAEAVQIRHWPVAPGVALAKPG
jgi:hypothetical protein